MCGSGSDIFLGLLAILFPPLAVWVKRGICSADSIINILLCVLGFIPGLIHAWYIIAKFPEREDYERVPQDYERGHGHSHEGRVTYVYVQPPRPHAQPNAQQQHQKQPGQQQGQNAGPVNYGTASTNNAGASSSSNNDNNNAGGEHAPPTYAEAVKGDHKIQSDN